MKHILLLLIGASFSATTLAAGTAEYRMNGETTVRYAWRGDAVRMRAGQQDGYMLMRDGEIYTVTNQGGQPRVMAMSGMMEALGNAASQDAAAAPVESYSLTPTGGSETIAGISGQTYTATSVRADGSREIAEMVLTDNSLVAELTRAMSSIGSSFLNQDNPVAQDFLARGQGVLRFTDSEGNTMLLASIAADAPPASAFELPAKPMKMPNLGALIQAQTTAGATAAEPKASNDDGGGLFGGLFGDGDQQGVVGNKVERQKERQSSHVQKRVDQETDSAIDKAVDGVLDSLFGR